jgi:hypothetical protein
LEEKFNILPASPENMDQFILLAEKELIPLYEQLGIRLIAAWFCHAEWYGQITQITEFDDMEALKKFRINVNQNAAWGRFTAQAEQMSPERFTRILEPLGSIPTEVLHKAISESQANPNGVYSLAILHANPYTIKEFIASFAESLKIFPILASWKVKGGDPNEVIDLWRANLMPEKYEPFNPAMKLFFDTLRVHAPKEKLFTIYPLPYSPLK